MGSIKPLTKDDWLTQAMELLRTQGVGGVRVLTLAKSLKISRGSFYWHFHDRQDLLDHMLDWWDREMTDTVIRYVSKINGKAQKRILALGEFVVRNNMNRYDSAIRTWAEGDRKAATVLERVMKKRLATMTDLFREAGFSKAEATTRGHLLAIYIMSEDAVHLNDSLRTRLQLVRRQVQALTSSE